MKNLSIILAILFLAFTVEAQNVERTKRTTDKKPTKTSVSKSSDKSSKTKKVKAPATSKSRDAKSSSSETRSSSNRNTKYSSDSPVTRSSKSRISSSNKPPTQNSTARKSSNNVSRSVSTRKLNTESSNSRVRSTGSGSVSAQRNGKTQSVRGDDYTPKTNESHVASRKVYTNNKNRIYRKPPSKNYTHQSLDYRRVHNPYIIPKIASILWNANMYRNYRNWYPDFNLWYYPYGYRIHTISAYDSYNYIGEVARIYGRVSEVWYSGETGEYYLYFGGPYPYQDFTIILESKDAKRFSWNPVRYFTNRHLTVTGLVSLFEDKPEMQIRKRSQISVY